MVRTAKSADKKTTAKKTTVSDAQEATNEVVQTTAPVVAEQPK